MEKKLNNFRKLSLVSIMYTLDGSYRILMSAVRRILVMWNVIKSLIWIRFIFQPLIYFKPLISAIAGMKARLLGLCAQSYRKMELTILQ